MNNLLMTEREEHAKHRRITNPAFHHQNLKDMVELMVNETAAHIHPWTSAAADGAIIDLRSATITSPLLCDRSQHQAGGAPLSLPFPHCSRFSCLFRLAMRRREMSSLTFSIIAACAFGSGFASVWGFICTHHHMLAYDSLFHGALLISSGIHSVCLCTRFQMLVTSSIKDWREDSQSHSVDSSSSRMCCRSSEIYPFWERLRGPRSMRR